MVAFTDRHGGVSAAPWDTLNLALHVADERRHVRHNRHRVLTALQRPASSWVSVQQVHGDTVAEVTCGASPHIEADALITRDRSATLAILTADCVPVLLACARGAAVAAVHAGWRGTHKRIATRAAEALAQVAHCKPSTLHAAVGPAIGPCCFAVDAQVAQLLQAAYPDCAAAFHSGQDATAPKTHVDLWALNVAALMDAGLARVHIDVTRTCTACSPKHFSHRRDGPCGRQAGLIARP